jgi:protein TonB
MNEFELEAMLGEVIASASNPAPPDGLEARLKARFFAMDMTAVAMPGDVLTFGTLDQMASGQQTRKTAVSALMLHAAVLLLVFFEMRAMQLRVTAPTMLESEVILNAPPTPQPPLPPSAKRADGGGGHAGVAPVTRGTPPPPAVQQLVPPEVKPVEDAKLPVMTTVDVQADAREEILPAAGIVSASAAPAASLGDGIGSGVGHGNGAGLGAGAGGNMGGGIRHIGGGVSAPVPLYTPDAEFSEEGRKQKVAGNVLVYLEVNAEGRPQNVRVLRGIGMGLDEKAIEAVKQYRFKPAMENGKPVTVAMHVEVNFQIF